MIMGLVKVICIFFPLSFVEKIGRKPFLYLSTLGMMFAHMLSAVAFYPGFVIFFSFLFSLSLFSFSFVSPVLFSLQLPQQHIHTNRGTNGNLGFLLNLPLCWFLLSRNWPNKLGHHIRDFSIKNSRKGDEFCYFS